MNLEQKLQEMKRRDQLAEEGGGREGSRHGVEEFVEIKYMLMGGLDR